MTVDGGDVIYSGHERDHPRARFLAGLPPVHRDPSTFLDGSRAGADPHSAGRELRADTGASVAAEPGPEAELSQHRAVAVGRDVAAGSPAVAPGSTAARALVCPADPGPGASAFAGGLLPVASGEPAAVSLQHVLLRHGHADCLGIPAPVCLRVRVRAVSFRGVGVAVAGQCHMDRACGLAGAPGGDDAT